MTLKICFDGAPSSDDVQILGDGIMDHATRKKGFKPLDFFAFFIRDEQGVVFGGCNGCNLYGCLYIDQLWVSDALRGQGWGSQLMHAALLYGKEQGCSFSTVNTMSWEALGFYQKLGFQLEFQRHGFHKDAIFYFLRKELLGPQQTLHDRMVLRLLTVQDIPLLVSEFARHHWDKPSSIFELYLKEQTAKERIIWLAFHNEQLAGYVTLKWVSYYQPFKESLIPEIMDLNVLPPFRNKGIASLLLDTAEQAAAQQSPIVGLGVGLYDGYGAAQKLYIKRGYTPDGLGVTYHYEPVIPGTSAPVDDDLILWFTKKV